jgi:hypothetical protein
MQTIESLRARPIPPVSRAPLEDLDSIPVVAWIDDALDNVGHDPRSVYVEKFWLPLLGPTCVWMMRNIALSFESNPEGFELDFELTARQIGLGDRNGRRSPFQRSLRRLISFDIARATEHGDLAVRRFLPVVPAQYMIRLGAAAGESHRQWVEALADIDPGMTRLRWRARRIALGLMALDDDYATVESELLSWHLHPALAWDAANWAWRQGGSPNRRGGASDSQAGSPDSQAGSPDSQISALRGTTQ